MNYKKDIKWEDYEKAVFNDLYYKYQSPSLALSRIIEGSREDTVEE